MKSLCWNVHGLGNPRTFRAVRNGLRQYDPHLLVLMETKCRANAKNLNKIKLSFNYSGCFSVDCVGRNGGLCLFWKEEVDVLIRSYSKFHIDASIIWNSKVWRFSGLYGNPNANFRRHTWELLQRLHNHDESTWVVGGDFNATLMHEEKEGGIPVRDCQLQMFQNAMDECGLQDLDFEGDMFTWSNRQDVETQINERLDRFVANEAFL